MNFPEQRLSVHECIMDVVSLQKIFAIHVLLCVFLQTTDFYCVNKSLGKFLTNCVTKIGLVFILFLILLQDYDLINWNQWNVIQEKCWTVPEKEKPAEKENFFNMFALWGPWMDSPTQAQSKTYSIKINYRHIPFYFIVMNAGSPKKDQECKRTETSWVSHYETLWTLRKKHFYVNDPLWEKNHTDSYSEFRQ